MLTIYDAQVLSYEIEYRQPSSEGLRIVTDFSRKTGDYASLSATDLKVGLIGYFSDSTVPVPSK
jgi:RNA-binding protein NOB1